MAGVKQLAPKKAKLKKLHTTTKVEKKKKTKALDKVLIKQKLSDDNHIKITPAVSTNALNIKKKSKHALPSSSISAELVNKAVNAIQQLTIHYKKKNSILEDELPIFAEINCIKIQSSKGNIKLFLPHSTVASTGEVCLITPDLKKGRKIDHEPTTDHWEELLKNAGVTAVKTVLPMRQLRVEYDQYELKRRLLTQHDFILVDTRVLNHVSHLLGNMFFKKHNMLVPVRIDEKKNLKKDIDVGLQTVMLRLSEGATSTVIVGHSGMPQKDVEKNVLVLVQQLKEKFPGGEANIRSIALKLPLSLSVPLFVTLRSSSTITTPKLKRHKPKNFSMLEDELSTIPGSRVRVGPDGTVHLQKGKSDMSDLEEEEEATKEEQSEKEED